MDLNSDDNNKSANNIQTIAIHAPFSTLRIQCAGPHFITHLGRIRNGHEGNLSHSSSIDKISDNENVIEFVFDVDYLKSLDPKEWKDQDHYHVLGLKDFRYSATDDDIKRAYRKIVLKHHPDKRKAQGEDVHTDDDYFICITRAYETLGNPIKRRSYDSIDPEFDDLLPTAGDAEKDFFGIFGKYFALNARWSERKNVPELGNDNSTRQHVDNFYNYWYDFDSWREFSYLDEEDKDKGQDREERRWIDKQNKVIRLKRKKEEMARIRQLVDLAYNNDPRIVKFKNEDKEKKQAAKRARMNVVQAQRAEEDRILKEAQIAKELADKVEQKRIEQKRHENEKQKRAMKKERKLLRDTVKENNYYALTDKEKIYNMEGVEKICELLKFLELQDVNKDLCGGGGRESFIRVLKDTEARLEEERKALFDKKPQASSTYHDNLEKIQPTNQSLITVDKTTLWSPENIQILIKAVNLFPAGTNLRWEVIANYLNIHGQIPSEYNKQFTARDVLNKTKDLQNTDFTKNSLKSRVNDNAFASFERSKKELKIVDNADISVNTDNPTPMKKGPPQPQQQQQQKTQVNGISKESVAKGNSKTKKTSNLPAATTPSTAQNTSKLNGNVDKPPTKKEVIETNGATLINAGSTTSAKIWTTEEQSLLEQAMKTYPTSTVDRWDRIAECIPNRTKKECLRRVKEIVDIVNAKRDAMQIIK